MGRLFFPFWDLYQLYWAPGWIHLELVWDGVNAMEPWNWEAMYLSLTHFSCGSPSSTSSLHCHWSWAWCLCYLPKGMKQKPCVIMDIVGSHRNTNSWLYWQPHPCKSFTTWSLGDRLPCWFHSVYITSFLDLFIHQTILICSMIDIDMTTYSRMVFYWLSVPLVINNQQPYIFKDSFKWRLPRYHPELISYMMEHAAGEPCFQLRYRIPRNLCFICLQQTDLKLAAWCQSLHLPIFISISSLCWTWVQKIKIDRYMWRVLIIQTVVLSASKLMMPFIGNVFNEECSFKYELPGVDPKLSMGPLTGCQVRPPWWGLLLGMLLLPCPELETVISGEAAFWRFSSRRVVRAPTALWKRLWSLMDTTQNQSREACTHNRTMVSWSHPNEGHST